MACGRTAGTYMIQLLLVWTVTFYNCLVVLDESSGDHNDVPAL